MCQISNFQTLLLPGGTEDGSLLLCLSSFSLQHDKRDSFWVGNKYLLRWSQRGKKKKKAKTIAGKIRNKQPLTNSQTKWDRKGLRQQHCDMKYWNVWENNTEDQEIIAVEVIKTLKQEMKYTEKEYLENESKPLKGSKLGERTDKQMEEWSNCVHTWFISMSHCTWWAPSAFLPGSGSLMQTDLTWPPKIHFLAIIAIFWKKVPFLSGSALKFIWGFVDHEHLDRCL